jgi:hypothetical protein
MGKLLVWVTGFFFVLYGAAFTFFPVAMAALVTGDSPNTASGIIDLRATYGGMSCAIGVVILIAAAHEELQIALLITAIVLLAMAAGRVLGMFLDGSPNTIMYIYLAAEIVVSGLALWSRNSIERS